MIIKEKYAKSAKLNTLSGAIVFFADKIFKIKNINNFINSSQKILFERNLKNSNKKKIFLHSTLITIRRL